MTFYLDEFLFWQCPFLRIGTGWWDYMIDYTRLLGSRILASLKNTMCDNWNKLLPHSGITYPLCKTAVDKDILTLVNSKSGYNLTLHSYRIK